MMDVDREASTYFPFYQRYLLFLMEYTYSDFINTALYELINSQHILKSFNGDKILISKLLLQWQRESNILI